MIYTRYSWYYSWWAWWSISVYDWSEKGDRCLRRSSSLCHRKRCWDKYSYRRRRNWSEIISSGVLSCRCELDCWCAVSSWEWDYDSLPSKTTKNPYYTRKWFSFGAISGITEGYYARASLCYLWWRESALKWYYFSVVFAFSWKHHCARQQCCQIGFFFTGERVYSGSMTWDIL